MTVLIMDNAQRELERVDIRIRDGVIAAAGVVLEADGAETVLAACCVEHPRLVNTHHHLNQTLTLAVPRGWDSLLFCYL